MTEASIVINFNPSDMHKDWILQRLNFIREYYTITDYTFIDQTQVSGTVNFECVPSYMVNTIRRKLDACDYNYSIYLH